MEDSYLPSSSNHDIPGTGRLSSPISYDGSHSSHVLLFGDPVVAVGEQSIS